MIVGIFFLGQGWDNSVIEGRIIETTDQRNPSYKQRTLPSFIVSYKQNKYLPTSYVTGYILKQDKTQLKRAFFGAHRTNAWRDILLIMWNF